MELVKESGDQKIFKKRSGRFAIKGKDGKFINGDEKLKILQKEGLVKKLTAKPKEEPAPAEDVAPVETEEASE